MTQKELMTKLDEFRKLPDETEWLEFKEAKTKFDIGELGQYFSALSNEANLKNMDFGWLVFGIRDGDKSIVGSQFRRDRKSLDRLKNEISAQTNHRIGFHEIHELDLPEGRVIMFQIPAALRSIPTVWKGFCYGREGDAMGALSEEKRDRIRTQVIEDWSKGICPDATLEDLEPAAVARARELYKKRFPDDADEVDKWNDLTFLNKSKITIKNQITRAAIILLGKSESEHFISPAVAKMRWILKDSKGNEKDYLIKSCPFILTIDDIYAKIRNVTYRLAAGDKLFPEEMQQYSPNLIYEAINNCIAHQDYTLKGRITVVEMEDELIFTNLGEFIPGSVEKVIKDNTPEEKYRNEFLCTAMFNYRMVQTRGGGIRMMFNEQTKRYFPLPDYDLPNSRVKVKIIGKVLDMNYAQLLAQVKDLTLDEIVLLDKVQKGHGKSLTKDEVKRLRARGLIEGSKPNYFISVELAQKTGKKAEYTKAKGFDKEKYFELIINFIKQHGFAERKDITELLSNVLPSWMDEKQKYNKISHLFAELREKGKIKNVGSDFKSKWIL